MFSWEGRKSVSVKKNQLAEDRMYNSSFHMHQLFVGQLENNTDDSKDFSPHDFFF